MWIMGRRSESIWTPRTKWKDRQSQWKSRAHNANVQKMMNESKRKMRHVNLPYKYKMERKKEQSEQKKSGAHNAEKIWNHVNVPSEVERETKEQREEP
jgi:hypothetical protein